MDFKDKIKRDLMVMSLEDKEKIFDNFKIETKETPKNNIKDRIKKIPILGFLAWYFYNIFKAPFKIKAIYEEQNRLNKEQEKINEILSYLKKEQDKIESHLSEIFNELYFRFNDPENYKVLELPKIISNNNKEVDLYVVLEDTFRGDDLGEKLEKYLPFIYEAKEKVKDGIPFLDFGFGRGEFIKTLEKNGFSAIGVDINPVYVEELRKDGYKVYLMDGVDFLSSLEDNSLLGISAFHVIEHMDFARLNKFIELSYKKISKGGVLIVETPNPKCSVALANFYIDFSHKRPCPYELIHFLFDFYGFSDIKILLSTPADKWFRTGNPFCDYMDYAILGFKR